MAAHRPKPERQAQDQAWRTLMASAQDGDGEAYRRLLSECAPFIRSLARRRIVDEALLEDVVQETLLTVHRVRMTYDPARSFSAWLGAIADRRAVDALRRRGRQRRREVHDARAYETFADPVANKEDAGAASATIAALLPGLPPKQREALELLKVREMSLSEAASVSGQSVGTLKVNVHRALKSLRERLQGGPR
jgi:RNA polymerase sigma-70 factor (ECF subfamily)